MTSPLGESGWDASNSSFKSRVVNSSGGVANPGRRSLSSPLFIPVHPPILPGSNTAIRYTTYTAHIAHASGKLTEPRRSVPKMAATAMK